MHEEGAAIMRVALSNSNTFSSLKIELSQEGKLTGNTCVLDITKIYNNTQS